MDGARSPAGLGPGPGLIGRYLIGWYLSGLCVAGLGLCAAGWLVLTPFAFGYQSRGWHLETLTDLATGGGLGVICLVTLAAWAVIWRRALRADGVLSRPEPRPARARRRPDRGHAAKAPAADPDQVLTALRALLAPMLDPAAEQEQEQREDTAVAAVVPEPRSAPTAESRVAVAGTRVAAAAPAVIPAGPEGIAVIESMLAGAELLMTGYDEEEVW